jgi:hypothetical protein
MCGETPAFTPPIPTFLNKIGNTGIALTDIKELDSSGIMCWVEARENRDSHGSLLDLLVVDSTIY